MRQIKIITAVIPAQAGIPISNLLSKKKFKGWIPAFAGMTFLVFASCTKEKRNAPVSSNPTTSGPATLSTIQYDVFRLGCAVSGCHDNRANPAASLNLTDASLAYDQIVDKPSSQLPQVKLIAPGDPDNSYMILKLRGTHLGVGGSGDRMPQYAAALSQEDLDRITDWVTNGAQRN